MIDRIPFGRTGHASSRTIFGAAALGEVSQARADRTLELLLYYGVNHIDTAPSYGEAELRIGPWMERYPDQFFLATKIDKRTAREATDQFRRSLERLRVDRVDLVQLHNLVDPEEWEVATGPGGALEAAIAAREEGLVRYIGVTGHGVTAPEMHQRSLERFDFDSVLLPYNFTMMQNPHYAAGFDALLARCQERSVAVQTIKSLARGPWGQKTRTRSTWYEPLEEENAIETAVHWALGRMGIFLNTVGDLGLLPKVLEAANHRRVSPSNQDMKRLVARFDMKPIFT